jgi:hypothetical protein
MRFGPVSAGGVHVQLVDRVLVLVLQLLARGVDVGMRVLVGVGVLVSMRVDGVPMRMLMGVDVCVGVRMQMVMLSMVSHGMHLS